MLFMTVDEANDVSADEIHDAVFAYTRELGDDKMLVVTNLAKHACLCAVDPEGATLLLANYQNIDPAQLLPYEARVYKIPKETELNG